MLLLVLNADGVRAVLISERNQENEMVSRMTHRGIGVTKLMSQVRTLSARGGCEPRSFGAWR